MFDLKRKPGILHDILCQRAVAHNLGRIVEQGSAMRDELHGEGMFGLQNELMLLLAISCAPLQFLRSNRNKRHVARSRTK